MDQSALEQSLKNFREDILKAFADLDSELSAIRKFISETDIATATRLNILRKEAQGLIWKSQEHYAQAIRPAHETR